ncbi:hypothetical protein [Sulfurimonas sp. HSL3-7]
MTGFEIVAIISVISIFAWFIMAAKNTNSQNQFIEEDDSEEKE